MRKNLLGNSTGTISLEHNMERLALEANFIANAFTNLQGIVPKLTDKISNAINGLFNTDATPATENLIKINKDVLEISKIAPYNSFASFDRTLVTVPEGLDSNLITYVTALTSVSRELYVNTDEALSALQQLLSTFISNSEIKSSNKDKTGEFKAIAKKRDDITAEIGKFFTDKNVRSKMYITDAIGNFDDVDTLYKLTKTLSSINNNEVISAVDRKTKDALNLLKMLYEDMSTNPDTSISGAAAKNIANAAYEVAKCVELVGVFNFKISQVSACVHDLVLQLKKIMYNKK